MAKRTTVFKVKEIMPDTEQTYETIDKYIAIATVMVDDIAAVGTLGAAKLAEIERWLTAHLITITVERRAIEEEVGNDTRVKYSDIFGPGLRASEYGQMVETLDTTGTLAALGKKRISITAITSFD